MLWQVAAASAGEHPIRAVPWIRLGLAAVHTSTLLTAPAFDGPFALRSNTLAPAVSLGGGVEIDLRRWLSVTPHANAQAALVEDEHERDTKSVWGLEWR